MPSHPTTDSPGQQAWHSLLPQQQHGGASMGQTYSQQLVPQCQQQQRPPAPCQQPGRRTLPASFNMPSTQPSGRSRPRVHRAQGGLFPAPHQPARQPRQQQPQGRLRGQVHYPSSPAGSSHQPPPWLPHSATPSPAQGCTAHLPPPPDTSVSSLHPEAGPPAGSMQQQIPALQEEGPPWGAPPGQQPSSTSHAPACTAGDAAGPPPPNTPMGAMHLVSRPAAAPGREQLALHEFTSPIKAHRHPAEAPSLPRQPSQPGQQTAAVGPDSAATGEGTCQADGAAGGAIMIGQQGLDAGVFGFAVKAGLVHQWLGEDILGTTFFLRQLQVRDTYACLLISYINPLHGRRSMCLGE